MEDVETKIPVRDSSPMPETIETAELIRNSNEEDAQIPSAKEHIKQYLKCRSLLYESAFCVLYAIICGLATDFIFRMTPHERPIPYQNTTLFVSSLLAFDQDLAQAHLTDETIPDWLLIVSCIVLPAVLLPLVGFIFGPKYDGHSIFCVLAVAMGSTGFLTQFLKYYVGRLRPNFYSHCGYDSITQQSLHNGTNSMAMTNDELQMLREGKCNHEEARLSFPSGHASFAFCGMTIITLYLLGKLAMYRDFKFLYTLSSGNDAASPYQYGLTLPLWKRVAAIFSTSPLFYAIFVAASRLQDNWHHPADVVAGSLIGLFASLFTYALWYPSVFSPWAGTPILFLHNQLMESRVRSPSTNA